ncbi:hypothetical protein APX70_200312 [Pseudomonas syringae pv. maculicola]|uniref:Uncharacterized protein n=1 Tax=Pseudomonas syringae pv. maculicola TaxID=59511 RepID=A0A3M3ASG1_PSEYM|nr:hypothetical protein APX70_200312 [Pseudomonas syringae pv. maculicola]
MPVSCRRSRSTSSSTALAGTFRVCTWPLTFS